MVDISATHNFVREEWAKDLGRAYVFSDTLLKTVNALSTTVYGFAPRVQLVLGDWKGLTDFTIAPMDVFDIILGLDFWYEINAFISPHLNQFDIKDPGGLCVVPFIWVPENSVHLSAIQLVKGFKRGEPTFLAALMESLRISLRQQLCLLELRRSLIITRT